METVKVLCLFFCLFLVLSLVSASSYKIEFNQIDDKLVVSETINGVKQGAYTTQEGLEKSKEGYYFVKKLNFNQSYDEVEIKLNLDFGVIIENSEAYPSNYKLETDGRTISLVWKLQNIKENENFAIFVSLQDTNRTSSLISSILLIVFIIAVLSIVGYFIYKKFGRKNIPVKKAREKKRRKEKVMTEELKYEHLLDTEKKIIEELKKADRNELWQKQIQLATGFSKAKVSRLVRNLEARGLITKIPFGNTNKIRLK